MFDFSFDQKYVGVCCRVNNVDFGKITLMEYKLSLADRTISYEILRSLRFSLLAKYYRAPNFGCKGAINNSL